MAERFCTVDGCGKAYCARGFCSAHWAMWRKYGTPTPEWSDTCRVEGCSKPSRSKKAEMCETHYYRLRRTGSTADPITLAARPCSVEGCDRSARRRTPDSPDELGALCQMHYKRLQRRGNVDFEFVGANSPHWTGSGATGSAMHQRVRKARGPASSWGCVDCARPAKHWSYDHLDPMEHLDPVRGPYSVDVDHYFPRCVSCHKKFDMDFLRSKGASA